MKPKTDYCVIHPKAQEYIKNGAPKPIAQMTADEIPPVAISWGRTHVFPTGSWRNITPHYVKRLPPCRANCPVGNDIEGWLEAFGNGSESDALEILAGEQPLPAVCGRVCYHPCETACNRGVYDEAVNIRSVERVLGDKIISSGLRSKVKTKKESAGKILIAGGGPAGLAAAWTLARLGHKPEIIERAEKPGGLLMYGIPAYRLPKDVLGKEIGFLEKFGITISCGTSIEAVRGIERLKKEWDAIFLAPGAAGHRQSGVVSEKEWVVQNAIDFLRRVASGRPHHLGQKVVVVGGGNSAIDAARAALRCGSEVKIIYRRTRMEMPAYHEEIEAALAENIKIEFLINPVAVKEEITRSHYKLECIRNKLGEPDDSGRRRPEPIPGSEFELDVDTVIDAVGEFAAPEQLTESKSEIDLLKPINSFGMTNIDGVWIGGDFSSWDRTVAHAIGAGKRAGISIDNWLSGGKLINLGELQLGASGGVAFDSYFRGNIKNAYDGVDMVTFENLNDAYFRKCARLSERELEAQNRRDNFSEIVTGLSAEQAQQEASRCFHCGACDSCGNCHVFCPDGAVRRDPETLTLSFDVDHCKGCAICSSECPRGAIEMRKLENQ